VLEGRKPRFVVNVDGVAVGEVDEAVIVSWLNDMIVSVGKFFATKVDVVQYLLHKG
jgi:hypothetical protein